MVAHFTFTGFLLSEAAESLWIGDVFDHPGKIFAAIVFAIEADYVSTEETYCVDLDLLVAIAAFSCVVFLLKVHKIKRQVDEFEREERSKHKQTLMYPQFRILLCLRYLLVSKL